MECNTVSANLGGDGECTRRVADSGDVDVTSKWASSSGTDEKVRESLVFMFDYGTSECHTDENRVAFTSVKHRISLNDKSGLRLSVQLLHYLRRQLLDLGVVMSSSDNPSAKRGKAGERARRAAESDDLEGTAQWASSSGMDETTRVCLVRMLEFGATESHTAENRDAFNSVKNRISLNDKIGRRMAVQLLHHLRCHLLDLGVVMSPNDIIPAKRAKAAKASKVAE